jgi:hypothetical protein
MRDSGPLIGKHMEANIKLDSILEKQRKRYSLLLRIYELTDGDESKIITLEATDELDSKEILSIVDYLAGEGLVESLADEAPLLRISHRGVVEVEDSLLNPRNPTEHFAAQVIQYFNGTVGSVLTGNQNVANVRQEIADPQILDLLRELRRHLADERSDVHREGSELLEGLEAEVNALSPSESRINLYLKGLGAFVKDTGKDLLVEIGSKLITNQIGLP